MVVQSIVDVMYRGRECLILVCDQQMAHHARVDERITVDFPREVVVRELSVLLKEKGYCFEVVSSSSEFGCAHHTSLLCRLDKRDGIASAVMGYCTSRLR